MSRMLISKKSTKPGILVGMCVLLIIIGIMLFATSDGPYAMLGDDADDARLISKLAPILCLVAAVFVGASAAGYGKSYINIYDDHIEGIGLLSKGGMRAQSFHLYSGQYNVALEGTAYVCVKANGQSYYMHFSEEDARQIMACINGNYQPPQQANQYQAPQPQQPSQPAFKIVACPTCKTKCRVPAGEGHIVIKCPKCSCRFDDQA